MGLPASEELLRSIGCGRLVPAWIGVAALTGCITAVRHAEAPTVRMLLINDVYVSDTASDGTGGLARVARLRDSLARDGPVLLAIAGDFLSPSLLSKWYSGRQMIDVLNAARLDFATFGNHEFELRRDTLVARIAQSAFRWTSANCREADGSAFPGVSQWDTVTLGQLRIGIFGVTLTGDYARYVRCSDPDSAAHTAIRQLRAVGVDAIVGVTHQSLEADSALLAREPELTLILGGHEHEWHRLSVGGRHVLKADANARSAQLATLSYAGGKLSQATRLIPIGRSVGAHPEVQVLVDRWRDSVRRRLGPERVVAVATADIEGRDVVSRNRESSLGDIVTDAIRAGTGSDVALLTAGTMRLDDVLPAGPITNYMLESIFLFADESRIVTFPLTAARLRELLERSLSDQARGRGGFVQVSGVRFDFDPQRLSGQRIVGPLRRPSGGEFSATDTIRVAFGAFPACQRGDGYVVPEAGSECAKAESAPRAVDLLANYLAGTLGGRVTPPPADRMIQRDAAP